MAVEEPIYFSRTGKPEHRELWANNAAESKEELRRRALVLWYDLRSRQQEDGYEPAAAVWIGSARFQPAVEEIEAYAQDVSERLERERNHKESGLLDDDVQDTGPDITRSKETEPPSIVLDFGTDIDL